MVHNFCQIFIHGVNALFIGSSHLFGSAGAAPWCLLFLYFPGPELFGWPLP